MKYEKRNNPLRQQTPGNGKLFDSRLLQSEAGKMTNRTIGVLWYLFEKGDWVERDLFEFEIANFLHQNVGEEENQSNKLHFVRKPLGVDFVEFSEKKGYRLTNLGELLLRNYLEDNEEKSLKVYLEQLGKVRYPNHATKRVDERVKTYPFRMLFYFLLKCKSLTGEFLQTRFPYVINSMYLSEDGQLNIEDMPVGDQYKHFYNWDIKTLCDIGVLNCQPGPKRSDGKKVYGDVITINEKYKDLVESYFGGYTALHCFHREEGMEFARRKYIRSIRDSRYSEEVKKRDGYVCQLTGRSGWFLSRHNLQSYCVAHHIVPFEYRQRYLDEYGVDIDHPDYMTTVLGDKHDCIHHGIDADREKFLRKAFKLLSEEAMSRIELTEEKYLDLYNFKEDFQNNLFQNTSFVGV